MASAPAAVFTAGKSSSIAGRGALLEIRANQDRKALLPALWASVRLQNLAERRLDAMLVRLYARPDRPFGDSSWNDACLNSST
ncbi:MAG: hypothetical protein ACLQU4_07795 [Limisphaerales bacterium]